MHLHLLTATLSALTLACSAVAIGATSPERPSYGAELEGFDYPFPVQRFEFTSQQQTLTMAYMELTPAKPNGRTAVLLHGKNFCGATWESVARPLQAAGYRVLIPDQIGFCKSSKPAAYQFSFHQLAANTHALIEKLEIERPIVIGHSMGGMLAMRYALQYPQALQTLVLVNPIGLEDWLQKGVPYRSVDQWYAREQKTTAAGIQQYQLNTYYDGQWKPEYDRWVEMLAGMYQGAGGKQVAWNQARSGADPHTDAAADR
jgi:pimeloyl-ACP methyl ester carboxylesterase